MSSTSENAPSASDSPQVVTNPKFDWYQSESQIVLTLFVKKVKPEPESSVIFGESQIVAKLTAEPGLRIEKTFKLEKQVKPRGCSYKIFPSKVEIKLAKFDGSHWPRLEAVPEVEKAQSKSQPRNWDRVVNELDDKTDESDLAQLFQKIYEEGSDEVKKAMNKSFVESGGTELNTNWGAVGHDKVSIKPPDGMEWRSWDK
ncbi:Suppressor of G2 allele of [Nesidiocoris tenuis]|uniref:Suppressor of G2 allele of n=1 Tax=Nesidiocoris tenuis TaxID=355587 RepID=A0ABN7B3W0_9HEMI|nr:Suppressor of G2 allele of [Nesidiocoris tenuis]